jgi:hypothetical protein
MDFFSIFERFHKENIRYLLCGGLAVNIYGVPRMTADIDVLLDFETENIKRFEICMMNALYKSSLPISLNLLSDKNERIKLITEKNLIAFSYYNTKANTMSMDVLIDVPLTFEELWTRKNVRINDQIPINLVSLNDLIALKKYSNRKQDQEDIYLLSQLKNGN